MATRHHQNGSKISVAKSATRPPALQRLYVSCLDNNPGHHFVNSPPDESTMPPKKSIFRRDGAQHFQLVHRSQRDPLINDPDAGARVLKPVGRANDRKVSSNASVSR